MTENLEKIVALMAENPDLKGTFIEELLQTMLEGNFSEIDLPVDLSSERPVGDLNSLDMAINTQFGKYSEIEEGLIKRFREAKISEIEIDLEEEKKMKFELEKCRARFKILDPLRWSNIYDRFGQFDENETDAWGVRAGNKAVLMNVGHPLEALLGLIALRKMLED